MEVTEVELVIGDNPVTSSVRVRVSVAHLHTLCSSAVFTRCGCSTQVNNRTHGRCSVSDRVMEAFCDRSKTGGVKGRGWRLETGGWCPGADESDGRASSTRY